MEDYLSKEITTLNELLNNISLYIHNENELLIIEKAYNYAKKIHKNNTRLSGEDYILHPLNVAYILSNLEADSDTLVAGLLHDVITQGNDSIDNIKNEFGEEIAFLLNGVTTINKISLSAENEQEANYFKKILVGLTEDVRIIIIKLAERTHNMRTLWAIPKEKQAAKAKETLEILAPIAHRLGLSEIKTELEVLSLRYYKPDAYKSVDSLLDNTEEERNELVINLKNEIYDLLKENNINAKIKGRAKSIYSIYNKMQKGKKFNEIYDIYALRIIVDTEVECYQVLGLIHSKYKPLPKRFKDYIANPKNNMYQSLHTTVFGPKDKYYEIQIRTKQMDEIAEKGIASHWSYKEKGKKIQESLEEKLQFFRNIMELNNENLSEEDYLKEARKEIFGKNIYVYTPKGDVFELPQGSTPIDFAYRIHTKIGESMVGAIVNDNIVALNYKLKTGDIVKINTNKNSVPSIEWLQIVKTNQAKSKIKSYFSKIDKNLTIEKGKELLLKEIRKKKYVVNDIITNLNKIYNELKVDNDNDIYYGIGIGKFTSNYIINFFKNDNEKEKEEKVLSKFIKKDNKNFVVKNDILVDGIDEIKISLANCCKPIKGDKIIGYVTKNNGIVIHNINCKNIKDLDERIINVEWNNDVTKKYPANILIITDEKNNVLVNIVTFISSTAATVLNVNTIKKDNKNYFELKIEIESLEKLKKLLLNINQLPYVFSAERIFE